MEDNDSIINDLQSVLDTPRPFKELPKSAESSLHTEDYTSSSSDAVIRALQTLQQKIKKLELERVQAEKNFGSLEEHTNAYKELVYKSKASGWAETEKKEVMYRLQPTETSTPTEKDSYHGNHRSISTNNDTSTLHVQPKKLSCSSETAGCEVEQNIERPTKKFEEKSEEDMRASDKKVEALLSKARNLYCPSSSQPYATYVRHSKDRKADESEGHLAKRQHDSRVSILEKQLEYMRRLVHNAEQERSKATERMCAIEQEKENQVGKSTEAELERQNKKIAELELECYKLSTAHNLAEDKIQKLEGKLQNERQNHEKLMEQTEQLARVTEENKNLMLSLTPSLPPSPDPPVQDQHKKKKKRKRPSSTTASTSAPHSSTPTVRVSSAPPAQSKRAMPFVCGKSAHPSHSLTANVQQMLSALKQENPALCARITTKQRRKKGSGSEREIKQVISGLEDDLGALTFEFQKLSSEENPSSKETQKRLAAISEQMEKKSSHIKKLKSCLKKLDNESKDRVVRAQAVPSSRPLSNLSNREVQICVRGSNTRELLTKVKSIRDVLTNRDIQWV